MFILSKNLFKPQSSWPDRIANIITHPYQQSKWMFQKAPTVFDYVVKGQWKMSVAHVLCKALPNRKFCVSHQRKTFIHS